MVSQSNDPYEDEPPLDPAVERVRRKLARLMIGSIGIMVLGLIAIFSVIVYRITTEPPSAPIPAGAPAQVALMLPAGSTVLDSDLAVEAGRVQILLRVRLGDGTEQMHQFDGSSGREIRRYRIEGR